MRSLARSNTSGGFTLIEVVVSIGVFSLVLVGGFAAVGTMLNVQRDVYQRTVAASLVMTIADWRRQQDSAVQNNWTASNILVAAAKSPDASTVFIGGTRSDYTGGTWYTVKSTTTDSASSYNLTAYSDIIVMVSPAVDEAPTNYHAYNSVFTLWQGNAMEFNTANSRSDRRLRFLGRYVMPDGFN